MKRANYKFTIAAVVLSVLFILPSCGIQKRRYTKGFYIPGRAHVKMDKSQKEVEEDLSYHQIVKTESLQASMTRTIENKDGVSDQDASLKKNVDGPIPRSTPSTEMDKIPEKKVKTIDEIAPKESLSITGRDVFTSNTTKEDERTPGEIQKDRMGIISLSLICLVLFSMFILFFLPIGITLALSAARGIINSIGVISYILGIVLGFLSIAKQRNDDYQSIYGKIALWLALAIVILFIIALVIILLFIASWF